MNTRKILIVGSVLALVLILVLRLRGIEDRPLSRDEYYSVTAVQSVLKHGVPSFHGGGFYPRALPMQYATAGICRILGENEASHRVIPVFFSVFSIPLLFALARCFVPWQVAFAIAAAFAVSAWQTEFGRFARMYTALQFITLLFFYAYYQAYRLGNMRWKYIPHFMCCAAITLHTLGALLVPFLLAAAVFNREDLGKRCLKISPSLAVAGCISTGFVFFWLKLMSFIWDKGVENPYPVGFVPMAKAGLSSGLESSFSFPGIPGLWLALMFMAAMGFTSLLVLLRFKFDLNRADSSLALVTALIAVVFHQLALAGIAVGFLVWRHDLLTNIWKKPKLFFAVVAIGLIGIGWISFAIVNPEFLATAGGKSTSESLRRLFFGFPDVYRPTISPWIQWVPMLSAIVALGLVVELLRIRHLPWSEMLWHPIWVCAFFAVVYGTAPTDIATTRYWFILYPLILLIVGMGIYHAICGIAKRFSWTSLSAGAVAGVLFLSLFLLTEDFQLRPLTHPKDPEVVFRTGRFKKLSEHWYPRSDERSPALVMADAAKKGKMVVITSMMTASAYYFPDDVKPIIMMPRDLDPRYRRHSRDQGRLNNWSGFPMAGDEEELRRMTAEEESILFARFVEPAHQKSPEQIWGAALKSKERIALSEDGRIETLSISLAR
jgi:hypothetical protein